MVCWLFLALILSACSRPTPAVPLPEQTTPAESASVVPGNPVSDATVLPISLSPREVTERFYAWYTTYPGNVLLSGVYQTSEYLTVDLINTLAVFQREGLPVGLDPILCGPNVPEALAADEAVVDGVFATVLMHVLSAGGSRQDDVAVYLRQVDGIWKISYITCLGQVVGDAGMPPGPPTTGDQTIPEPTPFQPFAPDLGSTIELPAPNVQTTLPMPVLAHVGQPGEQIVLVLRWEDGTELVQLTTALADEQGAGLVITSLDWSTTEERPQPPSQPATLDLLSQQSGEILAQQPVMVLSPFDPQVEEITLYWVQGETVQAEKRLIPHTSLIGTAAISALLWGPVPGNLNGWTTALPTPAEVLSYPGRQEDWGHRVQLLGLTIQDRVAVVDLSKEVQAYGGGSARVQQLSEQMRQTLTQFPSVDDVRILVEGESEHVLQP